jgi:hypothetical protein
MSKFENQKIDVEQLRSFVEQAANSDYKGKYERLEF